MAQTDLGTTKETLVPEQSSASQRSTVFIVDDELAILDVVSRGLVNAGYDVKTFSSGREFERTVMHEAPDLCIMDLSLPDLDGVAILTDMAAHNYQGRILLISGHSSQLLRSVGRLAEDYQLNIIGCVRKPFTIKPLLEALKKSAGKTFVATRESVMHAIRSEQMIVHYQPIVALPNNNIVAAEALVRWQHPAEGLLPPYSFLNKLDKAGMNELTFGVLGHAFENKARWAKLGSKIDIAVNIPIHTVLDPQLNAELNKLSERFETPIEGLTLEILETDMIDDHRGLTAALSSLCMRGVRVSVDDFGTGFSSLSRLQRLPIDKVKIDKSFIRHCVTHIEDRKIAEAVIALAHALDMKVVAEGVETEDVARLLSQLGCDFAQGFLYGRAVTANEFGGLILHEAASLPSAAAKRS